MSSFRAQRLQRRIDDLKSHYDSLDEKHRLLVDDHGTETRSDEKLRLKKIIDETRQEMEKIGEEADQLEIELKQLGSPATATTPASTTTSASPHHSASQASARPVKLFYSYAHEDEDLRDKLNTHLKILLRQQIIDEWYDRDIQPGAEWADEIDENLESAQIILLLISADFIASDYCYGIELKRAMEKHEAREACVIPIILRDCDWSGESFGRLQALPRNAKPVTSFSNRDEAFADIARGIRRVAEGLRGDNG
jgi:hypothetical protein